MAIGESTYNSSTENGASGNTGRRTEQSYYPRLTFRNMNIKKGLYFEMRSGLLQIKILNVNDSFVADLEHPTEIIYLSPTKATLLARQIYAFKEYMNNDVVDENHAFGVNGGMNEKISYIAFHTNDNKDVMIDIGKFDGEGKIVESDRMILNKDYHYALEWNNLPSMDVERQFDNSIELNQILSLVEDFGHYMNGALAYSVADLTRYDVGRVLGKMDPIYDKLGIERLSGNRGGNRGTNNFLNNTGTSESKSYSSIQEMLE